MGGVWGVVSAGDATGEEKRLKIILFEGNNEDNLNRRINVGFLEGSWSFFNKIDMKIQSRHKIGGIS